MIIFEKQRLYMNAFLRAIGFSKYTTKKDTAMLKSSAAVFPEYMDYVHCDDASKVYEFNHHYAKNVGIKFYGTDDMDGEYDIDCLIPYVEGNHPIIPTDLCIEKKYSGFSFIASCEDIRVGVAIIFHLQNPIDYVNFLFDNENSLSKKQAYTVSLSALSNNGTILLGVSQSPGDEQKKIQDNKRRAGLTAAARSGDENAIESLTIEDMDTYAKISKRIQNEDVFTIVESSFMPYGLESDLYTIVADIVEVKKTTNKETFENIYLLTLSYNGILIDTAINSIDLVGEPMVGRRFKGVIWLQGKVEFKDPSTL